MSDLALRWNSTDLTADIAVEANDVARDEGLETAVLLSLFLDRRAEERDPLPDEQTDWRGWWADALPVVDGDRIGSRLWLLARAKQTTETLSRAQEYAAEALAWLTEDLVAEKVEVSASYPRGGMLGLTVSIYRPGQTNPIRYRYDAIWAAME